MAKRIGLGEASSSPSKVWETLESVVSLTELAWPKVLESANAELASVPSTVSAAGDGAFLTYGVFLDLFILRVLILLSYQI